MSKSKKEVPGKHGKFVRVEGENFDIILNILIGIRRSLGNLVKIPGQKLDEWQYVRKCSSESDWIRNGNHAEGKRSVNFFRFDDYAPMVFQKMRERFKISEDEYMHSLGPEQILKSFLTNNFDTLYELCSSGQSGSLFYYTKDKNYLIKTIP